MWTSAILLQEPHQNRWRAIVKFSHEDGRSLVSDFFTSSPSEQWLADEISRTLSTFESGDVLNATVATGPYVPPVKEPDPETTPEEQAKIDAQRDKFRLAQLQAEIDLKIRKPDNAEYVALVAKLSKAVNDGVLDAVAAVAVP